MPANPLRVAHRAALGVDKDLAGLFARYIGSEAHPQGRVLANYHQARAALLSILANGRLTRNTDALQALETLRRSLYDIGRLALPLAIELGRTSAAEQATAYTEAGAALTPALAYPDRVALEAGWTAAVDARLDPIAALIRADAEPGMIVNEEEGKPLGALQPAPMQSDAAAWMANATAAAWAAWLFGGKERAAGESRFLRQAVPAIDDRTTPCCLDVARRGQTVRMDEPFYTPEPPAFASEQMWTPFHFYCRTSIVLYLQEYDDGITERLQEAADAELGVRWLSKNALSRRGGG